MSRVPDDELIVSYIIITSIEVWLYLQVLGLNCNSRHFEYLSLVISQIPGEIAQVAIGIQIWSERLEVIDLSVITTFTYSEAIFLPFDRVQTNFHRENIRIDLFLTHPENELPVICFDFDQFHNSIEEFETQIPTKIEIYNEKYFSKIPTYW